MIFEESSESGECPTTLTNRFNQSNQKFGKIFTSNIVLGTFLRKLAILLKAVMANTSMLMLPIITYCLVLFHFYFQHLYAVHVVLSKFYICLLCICFFAKIFISLISVRIIVLIQLVKISVVDILDIYDEFN